MNSIWIIRRKIEQRSSKRISLQQSTSYGLSNCSSHPNRLSERTYRIKDGYGAELFGVSAKRSSYFQKWRNIGRHWCFDCRTKHFSMSKEKRQSNCLTTADFLQLLRRKQPSRSHARLSVPLAWGIGDKKHPTLKLCENEGKESHSPQTRNPLFFVFSCFMSCPGRRRF